MRTILSKKNQTIFDIALQEYGYVECVFSILAANAFLRPDISLDDGQLIFLPDETINQDVVDYYKKNDIYPSTGNDDYITLTPDDMVNITQKLNYSLNNGPTQFYAIRVPNLKGTLVVQIDYDIPSTVTQIHLEQSLDGEDFSIIPGTHFTLVDSVKSHTFSLIGLLTNYVRVVVDVCSAGVIKEIIYRV
ncbi:MAG: hypothetical protein HPY80_03430 [Bacteroidales bacterium]|nr:hypothetical protein [Bacteroidales bacterium]